MKKVVPAKRLEELRQVEQRLEAEARQIIASSPRRCGEIEVELADLRRLLESLDPQRGSRRQA